MHVETLHIAVHIGESGQVIIKRMSKPQGRAYSEVFIYTWGSLVYFGGFKILNFNSFGGFQKNKSFWRYGDFEDIFRGSLQKIIRGASFLCILESFLKIKVQKGNMFCGVSISDCLGGGKQQG